MIVSVKIIILGAGGDGVQLSLGGEAADGDVDAAPAPHLGQVQPPHHCHLGLLPIQM